MGNDLKEDFKDIVSSFDNMATTYGVRGKDGSNLFLQYKRRDIAFNLLKFGKPYTILDAGCGNGLLMAQLLRLPVRSVVGFDFSLQMLAETKRRLKEAGISPTRYALKSGMLQKMPFETNEFDAVVCVDVLHNLPTYQDVVNSIKEMCRVCKPNGIVVIEFKNRRNPLLHYKYKKHDSGHLPLKCYSLGQIKNILKAQGFSLVKSVPIGFPLKTFAPGIIIKARKHA